MEINVVIDLSHHNEISNFDQIVNDGIVGIIHKATEAMGVQDQKYANRKAKWLEMGKLWGSYHFASRGSGVDQADHFLSVANPSAKELCVLDYERGRNSGLMTISEAENFVTRIHDQTGKWPGLYSGNDIKEQLGNNTDTPLKNCWLWIAQYGPKPTKIPPAWKTWTLWQYTDGHFGPEPHSVNGVGSCDRDKFNGDLDALNRLWNVPIA